jgi:hypothetical protein
MPSTPVQTIVRVLAVCALLALIGVYAATLQTHISGSFEETTPENVLKNEYIKDVSEIQVALNAWGTIHHTGYPLFAILGNLFTHPVRAPGFEPAAAASLYALAWGMIALGGFGLLVGRLTGRPALAVLCLALLGLARSVWIHNVVAEVYSMSLAITVVMLLVALWPASWEGRSDARHRLAWLALLGGIGVAHHRAVVLVAPGLLYALWPHRETIRKQWRRAVPQAVGLALVGFVPYVYLPLRAWQGGAWVYGDPGNWNGFWIEFTGKEADRLVKLPTSFAALWDNVTGVADILVTELTLPGLLVGVGALALVLVTGPQRRTARVVALSAVGPLLFAVFYHTAVLPQAILMPVVLALVFAVALAIAQLADRARFVAAVCGVGIVVWGAALASLNYDYVRELVTNNTGQQTIARLEHLPRDGRPALMLPWGPHYAAASYARLVTGEYADVVMVDHKGNYRRLLAEGYQLYTLPETFYTYRPPWPTPYGSPSEWWSDHFGQLFLTSAAPGIVQVQAAMWLAEAREPLGTPVAYGITRRAAWLTCDTDSIYLHVIWLADTRPSGDPSIFVHLTGDDPAPNPPNADSRHPVYGLYPFAQWSPGELVRDDFTLPRLPDKTQVRFGLYEQDTSGGFVNYGETVLPVAGCEAVGD